MQYYPIFLKTDQKRILVSGGGETALAKLRLLMKTDAKIEVYSSRPQDQIQKWAQQGKLRHFARNIHQNDLKGAMLVYAAEDDDHENNRIYDLAKGASVLVNTVDRPEKCDFITPAIVDRDPVIVAIGTEGAAPVLARKIKAKLEEELSPKLGNFVQAAKEFRSRVQHWPSKKRRAFWSRLYNEADFDSNTPEKIINKQIKNAERADWKPAGFVSFVGAGPGDPELLTLKARKKIDQADIILHDRLVSAEILELPRREATIINVGKEGFGSSWSQKEINELMIQYAREGFDVVRLKSGDPVIFGRLDEETEALSEFGINFEVIPGISAANAAAAEVKASLTKRNRNSELRILTGHDLEGFAEHDWRALSKQGQCAAIYMGAKQAKKMRGRLLMHGASSETPITVVESVSQKNQHVIKTSLLDFPEAIERENLAGPIVILYGITPYSAIQHQLSKQVEIAQ